MTESGCQHFISYVKEYGLESFSVVHAFFSACISKEARKRKVNFKIKIISTYIIVKYSIIHYFFLIRTKSNLF